MINPAARGAKLTIELATEIDGVKNTYTDFITQRDDESDANFLKRAAVILECLRHRVV